MLSLKITSTQTIAGFPVTLTILPQQDVVVSTQYLSKNIGIVYTKTNTNFKNTTFENKKSTILEIQQ